MQASIELEQMKYDIKRLLSRSRAICPVLKGAMDAQVYGKWQLTEAMLTVLLDDLFKGERHA